jgi:hypothetical protein
MHWQRIELVCGVLGGALGFAVLGLALFAPLNMICGAGTGPRVRGGCVFMSSIQSEGLANLWLPVALFAVPLLGIILFVIWHSRTPTLPVLVPLWVCTLMVCVVSVLARTSIGTYFVPADVLALAAVITGSIAGQGAFPRGHETRWSSAAGHRIIRSGD